jgi:hypothetical protein
MAKRRINSRLLRQLAANFLEEVAEQFDVFGAEREDLTTSLVRQWITHEGCATLFFGEQQIYAVLSRTPLNRGKVTMVPASSDWANRLREDWRIDAEEIPEILRQLNWGQSTEIVNLDGTPLRLWVNPHERSRNVEPLVKETHEPVQRDYLKIALHELRRLLGNEVDEHELDEIGRSVATQWQRFDGHACVFLDEDEQALVRLTERPDGGCDVSTFLNPINLEPLLTSLGCSLEMIPDVIARLNLAQEIEIHDAQGEPSIIWHDPKLRKIRIRPLNAKKPVTARLQLASIFCPKCTAVLSPWRQGQEKQICPNCRHQVALTAST